ncbi:MAG: beta-galactosidase, partial [Lachnospiraceae bacterium]|nr:beta-galactosidase [Lachnospiraceae bacterium]
KQAVVQSMAHGGEMMLHFQFRTYPFGAEQLNYAIVDMDGVPRRRYREMQETAALLKKLEPLENTAFPREAAVCFDYDSHWALRIKPVNDPAFHYVDYCGKLYHYLENIGVTADVTSLKADWSSYRVVILPAAIILSFEEQEKVKRFVEQGGTVIATFLTSVKNKDNVGYTESLPAGLTEVFGSVVEEVEPVFDGNHTKLRLCMESYEALCHMEETEDNVLESTDGMWSELLGGVSETLGSYLEDYKEGAKVVSAFTCGKGRAYYVGTDLEPEAYRIFLKGIMKEAGVHRSPVEREAGVDLVTRFGEDKEYLFLFNFTARETEVVLPAGFQDYLTGEKLGTKCRIARNGILIAAGKRGN